MLLIVELPVVWVLSSAALVGASRMMPGLKVETWRVALKASLVYGLLWTAGSALLWLFLPLSWLLPKVVMKLLGFVVVSIPALYATEIFVTGFEVEDLTTAAKASAVVVLVNLAFALAVAAG